MNVKEYALTLGSLFVSVIEFFRWVVYFEDELGTEK
jgi:hypothetical protein